MGIVGIIERLFPTLRFPGSPELDIVRRLQLDAIDRRQDIDWEVIDGPSGRGLQPQPPVVGCIG